MESGLCSLQYVCSASDFSVFATFQGRNKPHAKGEEMRMRYVKGLDISCLAGGKGESREIVLRGDAICFKGHASYSTISYSACPHKPYLPYTR